MILTWIVFLVSFAIPATDVLVTKNGPLTGWQACLHSIAVPLTHPLALIAMVSDDPASLLLFAVPFVNVIMFVSPVFAARSPFSWFWCPLLAVSGIMPWLLPGDLLGNVFVGFYCWNGSFWAMTILCLTAPRLDMS
jgi:hypothetical protein